MRALVALLFTFIFFVQASAQEKISTDRPGETLSADRVSKGVFQAETGFEKEQEEKQAFTIDHPHLLLRYGLFHRLEIRMESAYTTEKQSGIPDSKLSPPEAGFKLGVLENKGALPKTSLLVQVGFPGLVHGKNEGKPDPYPRIRLLFENELSKKVQLGYNAGVEWDEAHTHARWVCTLSPQIELSKKLNLYLEAFSFFEKAKTPEDHVDAGLGYFLSRNVFWDINGGIEIGHSSHYFVGTGLSFRLQ